MQKRQRAVNSKESEKRSAAGDAFSQVAFRVLRLAGQLGAAGDALAGPAGQSSARWQVLAAAEHGPVTVAQIARILGLARQSVQRVADLLAKDGLAGYRTNPDHQRAMLLELTPRGRSVLATIQRAQRTWADRLGGAVGEAHLRRTAAVLDQVSAALAHEAGDA